MFVFHYLTTTSQACAHLRILLNNNQTTSWSPLHHFLPGMIPVQIVTLLRLSQVTIVTCYDYRLPATSLQFKPQSNSGCPYPKCNSSFHSSFILLISAANFYIQYNLHEWWLLPVWPLTVVTTNSFLFCSWSCFFGATTDTAPAATEEGKVFTYRPIGRHCFSMQ